MIEHGTTIRVACVSSTVPVQNSQREDKLQSLLSRKNPLFVIHIFRTTRFSRTIEWAHASSCSLAIRDKYWK